MILVTFGTFSDQILSLAPRPTAMAPPIPCPAVRRVDTLRTSSDVAVFIALSGPRLTAFPLFFVSPFVLSAAPWLLRVLLT